MKYTSYPSVGALIKKSWIIVCLVVFLFSGFGHYAQFISFGSTVEAAGTTPKVDLVAILVDDAIYGAVKGDLDWYTNTYIPAHAPGTKSLVIPIDPQGFHATDIQKILANLYYEGQKGVPSQLVGVILFGNIPMPVVDLDGKRFVSVYPYVDFDDPMFRYDPVSDVFVFGDHPESLPELRHSTFPTRDTGLFTKFFSKLKEYDASPTNYAKPMLWYDDFPGMKNSYSEEERARYINTLLFAEAQKEEQYVPVFSRLLNRNYEEDTIQAMKEAKSVIDGLAGPAKSDESIVGDPKAEAAVDGVFQGLDTLLGHLDPKEIEKNPIEIGEKPVPTKLLEKEMQQEFQPNYSIFGNTYLSELQDNVLAGGRYQLEDVDTSLEKMEILDRVAKQFITDMNLILETSLDSQVKKEEYPLKYALPYRYTKRKPRYGESCGMLWNANNELVQVYYDKKFFKKVFGGLLKNLANSLFGGQQVGGYFRQGDFMGLVKLGSRYYLNSLVQRFGKEVFEYARYENHYFGKNAVDITSYKDLSIYRGSYFNQLSIDQLRKLSPTIREDEIDDIPRTRTKSSIGSSAGWFAQQVEQNRSYNMMTQALDDKEIYDAMKCDDEQELDDFSYAYRGGGSPLNIDADAFAKDAKRPITKVNKTNVSLAWNPSVDRQVGAPWYDPAGARLVIKEIPKDQLHISAHHDFGSMIALWEEPKTERLMRATGAFPRGSNYRSILDARIDWCLPRRQLNDYPGRTSFEEVDYFWVFENRFPKGPEWLGITVQPTIGAEEDLDDDRIPNQVDPDRDGDRVFDFADVNAGVAGSTWTPTVSPLQPSDSFDPLEEEESEEDTGGVTSVPSQEAETTDVSLWWNGGVVPGDVQPVGLSNESLPTNTDYKDNKKTSTASSSKTSGTRVCLGSSCPGGSCGGCVGGSCGVGGCQGGSCAAGSKGCSGGGGSCSGGSCGGGGGKAPNGGGNGPQKNGGEPPEGPMCTYPALSLSPEQIALKFVGPRQSFNFSTLLTKEYLVVDMSLPRCDDCIDFAIQKNLDTDFQARVSEGSSCDFAVLTQENNLGKRINTIGGANTFVGERSRENLPINGSYFDLPKKFGGSPLTVTPTYYIINRKGQIVVSRQGALPDLFYDLCVPQCQSPESQPPSGQKQAAAGGGCGCSGGKPAPKEQPKDDNKETTEPDMTYDVPFNIKGRNIDGDRTANANDRDMDGDGIANGDDRDTDGDGLQNISDPDIDNDCLPNGLDPDIDQDGLENRKDADADADGVPDQRDDDIDADGIANTDDEDSDADGEPDAQELDADKDGTPNKADKSCGGCGGGCGGGGGGSCNGESRDVDGDQLPNNEDDDIDGDGVLNPFDSDMDGDGLLNNEDADIDGDGMQNREDADMDSDFLLNVQDDDKDSDGELNDFDETPNGYRPPFANAIALKIFEENCVGQVDDVDDDGISNNTDYDIDGDGRGNREDPDMDADGILNVEDSDVDCDGKTNGQDNDTDGDGVPNDQDGDVDGDGLTNDIDPDIDGDGLPNGKDGDVDGDGMPNGVDLDVDGDQLPNHTDLDIDGDGIPNESDLDIDGDGLPNDMRLDENLNDGVGTSGSGNSSCAKNQANQSSTGGSSCSGTKSGGCGGGCGGGKSGGEYTAGKNDANNVDTDEDGTPDSKDADIDNDGTPNEQDGDVDGDGLSNDQDTGTSPDTDSDGDGTPNDQDTDIDGDGKDNEYDTDSDGDGIPNEQDSDADADGLSSLGENGGAGEDVTPYGPGGKRDPKTGLYTDGLRSKRKDRGSLCFLTGHDYRYQIIDTVVKHVAPEPEEVDAMNILTFERPVDDSRYMAFHGLGGEVVEFIYPDLWNIPLYDCNLLDPEAIDKNIRTYLRQKVEYYNQLLDIQLSKAPAHYAKHPAAFDFLATVDIAATPNRSYDLIPKDYFIDILGDKQIKRLSELLYYLSLGWDTRPQAATIGEFIEKARDRFDWNSKQAYVLEEFLKYDKDDERKFDPIAYPTHIPKDYTYEVGYINSDGYDLIQNQVDFLEKELIVPKLPTYDQNKNTPGDLNHTGAAEQLSDSTTRDTVCGIPAEKAVALPKWPKAFTCWLEKTLEQPFEFKIKISVDMKDRYDGGKISDPEGDDESTDWGPLQDQLDSWGDQRRNLKFGYQKPRLVPERLVKNSLTPFLTDTNKLLVGMGGIVSAQQIQIAEQKQLPPSQKDKEKELQKDIEISLTNKGGFSLSEQEQSFLVFHARTDFGPVRLRLTGTGDVCASVEGKNLCTQSLQLTNTLYNTSLRLPIRLLGDRAGKGSLLVSLCLVNDPASCVDKNVEYFLAPGKLDSLRLLFPTNKVVRGGVIPLGLRGLDAKSNTVFRVPDSFQIALSGASFSNQEHIENKSIAGLDQGYMLIYPQSGTDRVIVQVTAPESIQQDTIRKTLGTTSIQVVSGARSIINNQGLSLKHITYRLPKKETGFFSYDDKKGFLFRNNVPSFRLGIVEEGTIDHLKTPIEIKSLKGLVRVGYVVGDEKTGFHFFDENLYVTNGKEPLRLWFLPLGKSGRETLEITSPGMKTTYVTLDILPSGPEKMNMQLDQSTLRVGGESTLDITLTDSWGNLFTEDTKVDLELWGGLTFVDTGAIEITSGDSKTASVSCKGGKATVTCSGGGGGGCGGRGKCGGTPSTPPGSSSSSDTSPAGDGQGNGDGSSTPPSPPGGSDTSAPPGLGVGDTNGDGAGQSDGSGTPPGGSDTSAPPGPGLGDGAGDGDGNGNEQNQQPKICADSPPTPPAGISTAWYDSEDATYSEFQAQIPETLWPSKPEQDINVMYLNLYGYPWGNISDTLQYLANSKTLAITTFWQGDAGSELGEVLTALIHPNGGVQDIRGNMISELVVDGGSVFLKLGHQGGVGSVLYGTHPEFDMIQFGEEYGTRPHKIVYTAGSPDSISQGSSFTGGKIYYNNQVIVDILRGYMDPHVHIRWSGSGNDWWVTYENIQIGTLWVYRDKGIPLEKTLLHPNYKFADVPFGGSSTDVLSLGVYLKSSLSDASSSPLFESIEASFDPRKNIGFRNNFKPITNFAQGMRMGPATQQFGGPFLINYGDPFLERVKDSRLVKYTDYDAGPGQSIFSDAKSILDVDTGDLTKDGKTDLIISYKDGSIRVLKNYGGGQPYKDIGHIMVVADGLKETFVGDVDGDGREDIMVSTQSDKLRVYLNKNGEIAVDGTIVCLDIPNGDVNVAQVRQLFVDDMDGDKKLDIITNDINGDIKVFYGGGTSRGGNYLSTDPFQCDENWKSRQQQQLVKSFSTILSGPIKDSSLRHRPELTMDEDNGGDDENDIPEDAANDLPDFYSMSENELISYMIAKGIHPGNFIKGNGKKKSQEELADLAYSKFGGMPNIKKMKKKEMKQYAKTKMEEVVKQTKEQADPQKLLERGIEELDARFELPDVLRPLSARGVPGFAAVAANDPIYPKTPRFDAEKQFTDLNGGVLEKGDLVKVTVSLVPVGTAGPVVYRERLDGPWVIYKDEYNKIDTFDRGSLPASAEIDWNIGQGYQFMIANLPLGGSVNFSYEVQYDGNGYINIQIETLKKERFKGPKNQSVAGSLVSETYAGGWQKRIRAFPDDGCRKEYRIFSPGEEKVKIDKFLEEKQKKYEQHFDDVRADLEEKVTDATTLDPITKSLGISPNLKNEAIEARIKQLGAQSLGALGGGDINFTLDADTYLNYFVDEAVQKIQDVFKESATTLLGDTNAFDKLGLFPDDYEFSYNKCQGFKFGKKMCGGGRPIPFNNDLLSPGAFHIFGCKPKAPIIPKIFPDFAGLPIFSFPANCGLWPLWPICPSGAGGVFGGVTSQFRTYVTRTTANGLGLSLCFGSNDFLKLPGPLGDVAGNCIVIAGNIGSQCTAADENDPSENPGPNQQVNNKDVEASTTLLPKQRDAYAIGSCDDKKQQSSPFKSPTNGGKKTNIPGNTTENQSTKAQLRENTRNGNRLDGYTNGGATIEDVFGGHGGDAFEVDYLKGGVGFQLKVEEGKIKGLVSCIFRKRKEKQIAYFANNALNMHITLALPDLEKLTEGREEARHISDTDTFQQAWKKRITVYKETQNSGKEGNFVAPEEKKIRKFLPKSITKATTDLLNNPFDKILQFFDQVPLVTVETRDVPLEIPLIYDEDFARYAFHLESRILRNEEILQEWQKVDWVDENSLQRMQQAMTNVKRNLNTLYEYKSLPGKLFALLHASDQYIITIFQFIDTFISKLTGWLQDNAMRFSHWVDFIITLKGIIKTRQLLIDFTVKRQDKCSKCRQDHYDYYSCKLKLLCVDLPVIPIPSFHLPDIFIDLSNIQIGLDLVIPKFRFVPRKMDLFQIPDLPLPRGIAVDIAIPTIPILPPPPTLPELPELDLDLDMTLPVLPPAPKIPAMSPAIKAVIKVFDLIGKFFCIFKGGIGLVREKFVKARVEQMTQRKQDIMPFDGIKIKMPVSPLQAYNYKIDATVDIKFDFKQLYDLAQEVADDWNKLVNTTVKKVKAETSNLFTPLKEDIIQAQDDLGLGGVGIDTDIKIDLTNPTSSLLLDDYVVQEWGKQRPRLLVGGPVKQVHAFLLENAEYVLSRQDLSRLHPQANSLIQDLREDPQVRPNIAGVQEVGKNVQSLLDTYETDISETKKLVQDDWDGFLDSLQEKRLLGTDLSTERFVTSLFASDPIFVDRLRQEPHPMESYFAMNELFVDGFSQSLARHSADELAMHQVQYDHLSNFLADLKTNISSARELIARSPQKENFARKQLSYTSQQQTIPLHEEPNEDVLVQNSPKNTQVDALRLAQTAGAGTAGTNQKSSLKVDFTQFIDGFFTPGKDGNYHNIIAREEKATSRYGKHTYQVADINADGQLDVINYDEHQIYVKYGKQQDSYGGGGYGGVTIGPFGSYQQLLASVKKTRGWYKTAAGTFKLWDEEEVAYEYSRQGHNYASMSFIRNNDPRMDGYVIMVTDEQQTSQDKKQGSHLPSDPSRTRYVLALPEPIPEEGLALEITDLIKKQSLASLKKAGKIIDILYYNGQSTTIEVLLQQLERKWWYTKHAPLRMERESVGGISGLFGKEERVLRKVGPWSRQQVAGAQAWGDDQLPGVDLALKRDLTGEIKARGPLMQGNINTTYTLNAKRHDNGKVIKNRLVRSGEVTQLEEGDELEVKNIDYTYPVEEQLLFVGMDQAGNIGQQEVRLNIIVPDLKINEIRYLGVGAEVETELSDTIDRGKIKFEKNRFGLWKPLLPDTFSVKPTDPIVVGGLYPFDKKITIKDETGQEVAQLDTQSGEISLTNGGAANQGNKGAGGTNGADGGNKSGGGGANGGDGGTNSGSNKSGCSTKVSCGANGKPRVEIIQKNSSGSGETQKVLMRVSYTPKQLGSGGIVLLDKEQYQLLNLDVGYLGKYRSGWCIAPINQECHIFVSKNGDVLIPEPRNNLYQGDVVYKNNSITYTFYTLSGRAVVRIPFISEKFE